MGLTFQGYERKDGSVGIRNYVLLLSMVHCSNTVTQQIAWHTGAMLSPMISVVWNSQINMHAHVLHCSRLP